jgi:hypothetical protein
MHTGSLKTTLSRRDAPLVFICFKSCKVKLTDCPLQGCAKMMVGRCDNILQFVGDINRFDVVCVHKRKQGLSHMSAPRCSCERLGCSRAFERSIYLIKNAFNSKAAPC